MVPKDKLSCLHADGFGEDGLAKYAGNDCRIGKDGEETTPTCLVHQYEDRSIKSDKNIDPTYEFKKSIIDYTVMEEYTYVPAYFVRRAGYQKLLCAIPEQFLLC